MVFREAASLSKPVFPFKGLVWWPLAAWLVIIVAFALVWLGVDESTVLAPLISAFLVVAVVTLVLLVISLLVFVPLGAYRIAASRNASERLFSAVLAVVFGVVNVVAASFALWAVASAYVLHAA